MGNQQSQAPQTTNRKPLTEEIEGGYSNENAPRTPVRGSGAAFDPRSPSAPRTPVAASTLPAEDPRSPMQSTRTPLKDVDMNAEPSETRKSVKPRPFNFAVSGAATTEASV